MKTALILSVSLILPGMAFAECPSNMEAEQLIECLAIEGAGESYQNWKKNFDKLVDETSSATTDKLVDIKPASGKSVNK